jgi:rubrerythrin
MVDISAIAGALTSLKASKDLLEAMVDLRTAGAFNEKRLELQSKIMDAQSYVFTVNEERAALVERVSDLEKQIAGMETWEAEKQRYKLKDIDPGSFVYALEGSMSRGEVPHWICTRCYEDGKKSILQYLGFGQTGADLRVNRWSCPVCSTIFRARKAIQPTFDEMEGQQNASP